MADAASTVRPTRTHENALPSHAQCHPRASMAIPNSWPPIVSTLLQAALRRVWAESFQEEGCTHLSDRLTVRSHGPDIFERLYRFGNRKKIFLGSRRRFRNLLNFLSGAGERWDGTGQMFLDVIASKKAHGKLQRIRCVLGGHSSGAKALNARGEKEVLDR